MRFQAGVLSYVLSIGVLVSTGLSVLILYLYYSRVEYQDYERRIRLLNNLETAEEICKSEYANLDIGETYVYDLYGKGIDSVSIERKKWGLLDVFAINSFHKQTNYKKVFTLAHYPTNQGKSAVYLSNERGVLSVVGDTKLTGDCYLPSAGIQSAYINRIGYTNDELIYGRELVSKKDFPESQLSTVFEELEQYAGLELALMDTSYSFYNETEVVQSSSMEVSSATEGNVVLKADGRIRFSKDASTSDLIAIASVIEFEEGFQGSGQFFATDTIIVGKDVKLEYPSALAVYNPTKPAQIYLAQGADVSGWLLLDGDNEGFRRRVIYLENESKVTGLIYCDGMVEMYGAVDGNVTTRKFLVRTPRGIYENYLLNAEIDATALHPEFLTLSQWFYSDSTAILKYVY